MQLGYVILYVKDVPQALEFYQAAFGVRKRFLHESGQYAEVETGTTTLAFCAVEIARDNGLSFDLGVKPAMEIAFLTGEVAEAYARAIAAGAVSELPPTVKPWGQTVAYVRDGEGFLVELCTPMHP